MNGFEPKVWSASQLRDGFHNGAIDPYATHFGLTPSILTELSRDAVDRRAFKISNVQCGKLGSTVDALPEGTDSDLVKSVEDGAVSHP